MANHQIIRDLIKEAGSQFVSVNFIKKDGSERQITFNPADHNDVKGTGTPTADPNIFRIRDIKLGAWRSFDARRVVCVRIKGQITRFYKED
jgi:hypothetical protein